MDLAAAYERSFERIRSLVDENNADVEVPTCPGWTVKDLVAHQADFFDVFKEDPQGGFSDGWGDRGVKKHADHSIQQCLDEVADHLKNSRDLFESRLAPVAVADVLAHEQDIRTAIDEPGAQDDPNIVPAIEMGISFIEKKSADKDLPTLKVVTDDLDRRIGEGEPALTLRTNNYELFRTIHGRRTADQVRSMDWDGDPEPWMPSLFLFGPTEEIVEK